MSTLLTPPNSRRPARTSSSSQSNTLVYLATAFGLVVVAVAGWMFLRSPAVSPVPPPPVPAAAAAPAVPVPPPKPAEMTMADFKLVPASRTLPETLAKEVRACRTGILIDLTNKEILWEKQADSPVEIASMTKMMTAYLLMRAVHEDKTATLQDVVPVTASASKIGGSQVWLATGEKFSLENLAQAMMIKSANDAAQLIAEHLGNGSGEAFVASMNEKARALGLPTMRFYNPHGLPPDPQRKRPENSGSARELAFLASRLLAYPDVVRWTSTEKAPFYHQIGANKVVYLENHNTLLGKYPGINGMKTGYTAKSMYCTTITCTQGGRTLIAVVTGCPRGLKGGYGAARDALVRKLLDWGYAQAPSQAQPIPAISNLPAPKKF